MRRRGRRAFLRFLARSLAVRKGRTALAWASVSLAVGLLAVMTQITLGIREKLGAELRAYGANIIVARENLSDGSVAAIRAIPDVEEADGQVYARLRAGGRGVEAVGLDLQLLAAGGALIEGRLPAAPGEVLAGSRLREALDLTAGRVVAVECGGRRARLLVTGFIERGGEEDRALFLSPANARSLAGRPAGVSAVLVRARPGEVEAVGARIRAILPGASVKTLRQVAGAEENLLRKIRLLLLLATAAVLLVSALGVASSVGASLLERRVEVGLMMAMGATRREIARFFRAEAALVGLAGGLGGFLIAGPVADAISRAAFETDLASSPLVLPASLAAGLALSTFASLLPLQKGLAVDPAAVLRGE